MTAVAESPTETTPSAQRNGNARPFSAFERLVAWRYLKPRRKEAAVSIVTLISLIGVTRGRERRRSHGPYLEPKWLRR